MQEIFMNMVMATTVGNFITFFLGILVLGMFCIKYESPKEIGVFASFIGYLMMTTVIIFGFLNGWVFAIGYMVACVVVSIFQVGIFDIRQVQRIRESERGRDTTSISYRWIYFVNYKDTKAEIKIDRSELASYIFGYIGCAPFLVIRWVFNEIIKNFSEWVAENIGSMLQRKLERIFSIQEINDRKAAATEAAQKRNEQ